MLAACLALICVELPDFPCVQVRLKDKPAWPPHALFDKESGNTHFARIGRRARADGEAVCVRGRNNQFAVRDRNPAVRCTLIDRDVKQR